MSVTRREFLVKTGVASAAVATAANRVSTAATAVQSGLSARTELPRNRVPLSFIIDDSTCLVNMGRFCMPQFATAWPNRDEYKKPWKSWPVEIPDSFVREFGTWSAEHDVQGKYSIVPYPACVGWLDREIPGWSRRELQDSLKLVRELMVPRWDIHPEMITHTRVIDLSTGRPIAEISDGTMENSFPQRDLSVDELANYLAYALKILKNCDLPCEGITTPGGFGNRVKDKLPLAVFQAVRDVYGSELPHYFKYVSEGEESVLPRLEHLRMDDNQLQSLTVNVPAGTGDWFGGWDGVRASEGHRYCNEDASAGRMVELIENRQPAIMLCHWPGMYCNGQLTGYRDFQKVVVALKNRFGQQTLWMKPSEIGRYFAAQQLAKISTEGDSLLVQAALGCKDFTLRIAGATNRRLRIKNDSVDSELSRAGSEAALASNGYCQTGEEVLVCFDLVRGTNRLQLI